MIYLLDLNYTLVGNSPQRGAPSIRPFINQLEQETYRQWLVELLRPHHVILITARPQRYREPTLERIEALCHWQPQEAYFAEISNRPPAIKKHLLLKYIFPRHGEDGTQYLAIESNPITRGMYRHHGIPSVRVDTEQSVERLVEVREDSEASL